MYQVRYREVPFRSTGVAKESVQWPPRNRTKFSSSIPVSTSVKLLHLTALSPDMFELLVHAHALHHAHTFTQLTPEEDHYFMWYV